MPNITWQEPRILMDLMALNLFAEKNGMEIPGPKELAIISPWLSDVEIEMRPGPWYQRLIVGEYEEYASLLDCVQAFRETEWEVMIAVLTYGKSPSGLYKDEERYESERKLLRCAIDKGTRVYLVPDLHAKGVITPLAIITGSTNITHSGLYAQYQNVNYFPFNHPDYEGNRIQLMSHFKGTLPTKEIR